MPQGVASYAFILLYYYRRQRTENRYGRVLEVVQAIACEHKPSPLPRLDATALLDQVAVALGVEKGI